MAIRTKLRDRILPNYTRGEEIFNMSSHIAGGGLALLALLACVAVAAWRRNPWDVASGIIYGATLILLYTMSSLYHGLRPEIPKKVFQVIDHCAIFFLIAGTYTPIAFGRFREMYPTISWAMFAFMWGACLLCVTLNAIDLHKFQIISMIGYIALGWCVVVFSKQIIRAITLPLFLWLLAGGISYTIGSVLYLLGKKRKWMHPVFHMFVILGSVLHFVCILLCFIRH